MCSMPEWPVCERLSKKLHLHFVKNEPVSHKRPSVKVKEE